MNVQIVVFGWQGLEAATVSALWEELTTSNGHKVHVEWVSGDGLRDGARARAWADFQKGDADLLVELDGDVIWEPGELLDLCEAAHQERGQYGAFASGEPVLRVRARGSREQDIRPPEMGLQRLQRQPVDVVRWAKRRKLEWPETDKPRVLLATDRPSWAFELRARQIVKHLGDRYQFMICPSSEVEGDCDVLVAFWWAELHGLLQHIDAKSVVMCMYDAFTWFPGSEGARRLPAYLECANVVAAANEGIEKALKRHFDKCPPVVITKSGVSSEEFQPAPFPKDLTVGWCGNSKAGDACGVEDLKGLEVIKQACELAGARLKVLDASEPGAQLAHEDMPAWYEGISVYACASVAEGTPNPVLEAMACGRPVVSTAVGQVPEMVTGGGGVLVARDAEVMADALRPFHKRGYLKEVGVKARKAAEAQSWESVMPAWADVLEKATEPFKPAPAPRPQRAPGENPTILCLADQPGWAHENGHKDMRRTIGDHFDIDIHLIYKWPQEPLPNLDLYDVIYVPYVLWKFAHLLPYNRCVGALRSECWPLKHSNDFGPAEYETINRFRAFQVVTRANFEALRDHCPNVRWLPNPVNLDRFPVTDKPEEVVAQWNGNASRMSARTGESVKGFHEVIKPACEAAEVPLHFAEYSTRRIKPEEMPIFYAGSNLFVHASEFEGCSKALLESMATYHAVISTDVGQVGEMHRNQIEHFGESGIILLERDRDAYVETLRELCAAPERVRHMGELNRREVEERWSWAHWGPKYVDFLEMAL